MSSQLPTFSPIIWVGGAITCFTIIHHIILIIKTLLQTSDLSPLRQYKTLKVFSTLIFLCNLLWNAIYVPVGFMQLNHPIFGCKFFFGVIMVIYYIGKCCIWCYNVLRLEFIFHGIPLGYDATFLKWLKIIFVISATLLSTSCILGMVPYQNSDGLCVLDFKLWANATIMGPDAIISCVCYWLFHRKMKILTNLYQLNQNQSDNAEDPDDAVSSQFLYVLRKFTILCASTIISTWISGTVAILFADWAMVMGSVDSIINVWCILLYDKRYDGIYMRVFGCIAKPEWNQSVMKHTKTHQDVSTPAMHTPLPAVRDNASNPTVTKSDPSSEAPEIEMVIR